MWKSPKATTIGLEKWLRSASTLLKMKKGTIFFPEAATKSYKNCSRLSSSQLLIYFKASTFIPQERNELFGTFDFLANVGGLLGLFIGFSLLSMIEFIYFLSLRIICNVKMYKTWWGKPEPKPNGSAVAPILHKTTSLNVS